MRATVVKDFKGVPDGKIYPQKYVSGDIVKGDLARVAIKEKWAVEDKGEPVSTDKKAPTAPQGDKTTAGQAGEKPPAIDIPANWKSLKAEDLQALAAKIDTKADLSDAKRAIAVIEAEIKNRVG